VASKQITFAEAQVGSKFGGRIKFEALKSVKPFCLPFPDNSFDTVTCIEVIEHLHPFIASQILAEASRVLKKDSQFILTTPNYRSLWPLLELVLERLSPVKYHEQHISKFTPNSFVKFVESCGLEVKNLSSIFYCAPFVSGISKTLANFLFVQENRLPTKLGSLLVLQARKINWADYD
jgi:SAM-dependent methyltransferase